MTMLQNQASDAVPNVLHDQGIPNTLGGVGVPAAAARLRPAVGAIVLAATALLATLAIIVAHAT